MDNQQHMIVNNEAGLELGAQLPLTDLELEEYGLSGADRQALEALADRIDERNPLSIAEFGHDIGEHTANYTDELLDQVKNADLEDLGEQLSLLVMSAKHTNLSPFADRSFKIPLIGRYLDRTKMTKDRLVQQFDSTKEQIDKLLQEVEFSRNGLTERITGLESMFLSVKEERIGFLKQLISFT